MALDRYVFVRTRFEALHRWKDAPDARSFLRDYHRHVFHVELCVPVTHGGRDVEFFALKADLDTFVGVNFAGKRLELSCEHMAEEVLRNFAGAACCEVSEDGENGARVYRRQS